MSANNENPGAKPSRQALSRQATLLLAVVAAIAGFAAVYGTMGGADNAAGVKNEAAGVKNEAAGVTDSAARSGPAAATAGKATAEAGAATASKLAAFVHKAPPEALPDVTFLDAAGAPKTLADFKGKTILLNLWATWCAPCREEMPSLDRLQQQLGSDSFEVVALAVDRTGVEAAGKFLKSINVEHLKLYADPTTKSGNVLRVLGMPTTILINAEGKEAGRLSGPAAWDSDEAKKLIEAARK